MIDAALRKMTLGFLNKSKDAYETIDAWLKKLALPVLISTANAAEFKQQLQGVDLCPDLLIVDSASKHTLQQINNACGPNHTARFFVINSPVRDPNLAEVYGWCEWPCKESQFQKCLVIALRTLRRIKSLEQALIDEKLLLDATKILWETQPETYSTINLAYKGVKDLATKHRRTISEEAKSIINEYKKRKKRP